jgi:hypothetical protein
MYNEETQDRGFELMVGQGFEIGRILYPVTDSVIPNAVVSTTEDGEFWYGDLCDADMSNLTLVAGQLKRTLTIESRTTNKTLRVSASV